MNIRCVKKCVGCYFIYGTRVYLKTDVDICGSVYNMKAQLFLNAVLALPLLPEIWTFLLFLNHFAPVKQNISDTVIYLLVILCFLLSYIYVSSKTRNVCFICNKIHVNTPFVDCCPLLTPSVCTCCILNDYYEKIFVLRASIVFVHLIGKYF